MGFNGYLNPLTNEAQVNDQILIYKIPTTASHEIGHQLGFAKENEANFIACLATMNHPDPYFRYSGFTFALRYCLNELYVRDRPQAEKLLKTINPGILENYKEVREFWASHKNPIEPLFQYTYSGYLKANKQPEGMKSYSYVVALLVNYFDDVKNVL
jgi:effector-binding domain-containing protein